VLLRPAVTKAVDDRQSFEARFGGDGALDYLSPAEYEATAGKEIIKEVA
jgi:hypothetical protein